MHGRWMMIKPHTAHIIDTTELVSYGLGEVMNVKSYDGCFQGEGLGYHPMVDESVVVM